MPDHATSTSPAVQAQLDRLTMMSPGRDVLGLERIKALLARLGDPHHALPPVFRVAGTNGKGSTCAFLRAMLEAAGYRVHAYTSPHLVRFNERIRIGGTLIDDTDLARTLARVLDQAEGLDASFFEITTAAAFLRFAEEPADACVIEVGLGGRLDATNAIERPLVCGIASLGIDHREFLLSADPALPVMGDMERIAFEKAGIAKWGAPLVTHSYSPAMNARIEDVARAAGATLMMRGRQWTSAPIGRSFSYADRSGKFYGKAPYLPGRHQLDNAALAIAMLRHQPLLPVSETAIKRGITTVRWLARLQRLGDGPLTAMIPGRAVWLDGGHNLDAAEALAAHLNKIGPVAVIAGFLANKDAEGFLRKIAPHIAQFCAIPVPNHACHAPEALCRMVAGAGVSAAWAAADVVSATRAMAATKSPDPLLICGSLYLAGEVLRANDEWPD